MRMRECGVHTGRRLPQPRYWVSENATELDARLYVISKNLTSCNSAAMLDSNNRTRSNQQPQKQTLSGNLRPVCHDDEWKKCHGDEWQNMKEAAQQESSFGVL